MKKITIVFISLLVLITGLSGCVDVELQTEENQKPVASFTYFPSEEIYEGVEITFTDTSTDEDGTIESWYWDFGIQEASATSTEQNPTYTYTAAGTYTVTLTVTDNESETDSTLQTISVEIHPGNRAPTAAFTYQIDEKTVTFTDRSSDADHDELTYLWDFGDETNSTEINPIHTYAENGTYTVSLTVNDGNESNTTSKVIAIGGTSGEPSNGEPPTNEPPTANFTALSSGLTILIIEVSTDNDGTIVSWLWEFGDGTTSNQKDPEPPHVYASAGTYTITLTVTDNDGAMDSLTQEITVEE